MSEVFYVATDGNDNWTGKLPSPNQGKTDGPFATLARAIESARGIRGAKIFVREGTYFLDKTLVLTPEHSGLTLSAFENETAMISGGSLIRGWKKVSVNDKELWFTKVPDRWFFREMWVNGERRRRARHPNSGYLEVKDLTEKTDNWFEGQTSFQFRRGDIKEWSTYNDAEVVVMCRWVDSRLPVKSIDESLCLITFPYKSVFQLAKGDPYYIENLLEVLDTPGEWYLSKRGELYYMPVAGEEMECVQVIAPRLEQVIRIEGNIEIGQFVEDLTFKGLTFSHTEWNLPEGMSGFAQAAVGVPGTIYAKGARNCTWENCTIKNIGNYAIELSMGCKRNKIINCKLHDLGAGGVKIGETVIREKLDEQASDNEIVGCQIYDGGKIFHPAVGVWIGQSPNNRIANNHIYDFYYTGVSIGWTWGYGPALATGNTLEHNHIHHIGIRSNGDGPILSDMGGVYTLGLHEGTVIRNNIFHDIAGIRYGGWGIYFDEGTTHILAENNIVYNTTHGGFHQHYGKENIVRNNIFAFGRDQQIQRSRSEEHISFIFEQNIVYWDSGVALAGSLDNLNIVFKKNIYYPFKDGQLRFCNLSFEEWQAKGMDEGSILADPLFINPKEGDFRLKNDSLAIKAGFKPISNLKK